MSSERATLASRCFSHIWCCNCCVNLTDRIKGAFMACFCPDSSSRFPVKDRAQATDSAAGGGSIEPLTTVTPEQTSHGSQVMIVKHTFVPYNEDELQVYAGQIIFVTHERNQWVYAMTELGEQGFLPSSYVQRVDNYTIQSEYEIDKIYRKKKKSRRAKNKITSQPTNHNKTIESNQHQPTLDQTTSNLSRCHENNLAKSLSFGEIELGDYDIFGYISDTSFHKSESEQSVVGSDYSAIVEPFYKKPSGKYLVLHSFHGEDEDDATILKGDCVTVLNKDDHDWYYIQTAEGVEGFVPRSYLWQATCSPVDLREEGEDVIL